MLKKRIIPCLDVQNGRVVKGVQFADLEDLADPVALGAFYAQEGADELVFYDIGATSENRGITAALVNQIASELSIPFTVGGGIRTLEDFYLVLGAGADKVSVNSAAILKPELISEGAKRFGSQCVVVSMDVRRSPDGLWQVYSHGGRQPTQMEAVAWARRAEALGAGELVVNAIHTDGMRSGFDVGLTRAVAEAVSIPVIASGGAGKAADFEAVLKAGKADGALAASIFHKKLLRIPDLKQQLAASGLAIRSERSLL